jgi:hypothetical protein
MSILRLLSCNTTSSPCDVLCIAKSNKKRGLHAPCNSTNILMTTISIPTFDFNSSAIKEDTLSI